MMFTLDLDDFSRPELLGLAKILVMVPHPATLAVAEAALDAFALRAAGEDPGPLDFDLPADGDRPAEEVMADLEAAALALRRRAAECFHRPLLRPLTAPLAALAATLAAEAARLKRQTAVLAVLLGGDDLV